jgi:hypothetical protein
MLRRNQGNLHMKKRKTTKTKRKQGEFRKRNRETTTLVGNNGSETHRKFPISFLETHDNIYHLPSNPICNHLREILKGVRWPESFCAAQAEICPPPSALFIVFVDSI